MTRRRGRSILTDVKHLFSLNPLAPAYQPQADAAEDAPPLAWCEFAGGLSEIGHHGEGFAYDNERPRHRVYLAPYRLASRLVTNGEYLQFIDAGAYREPLYWLAEGWDWKTAAGRRHPLYWRQEDGDGWNEFTLDGLAPLRRDAPLVHVSYYEADAFARWAGARLPSEAEWENAACASETQQISSRSPRLSQLYGFAWQWTSSSYSPYPGFAPGAGAIGEYNGKFMVNQYVLRGSSSATPVGHSRPSYRNFFPAAACWQFSGIRLASDA